MSRATRTLLGETPSACDAAPAPTLDRLRAPDLGIHVWEERYGLACVQYRVCRLVEELGKMAPDEDSAALIRLHDEETGVRDELPLA